jgi:hypothetical protein
MQPNTSKAGLPPQGRDAPTIGGCGNIVRAGMANFSVELRSFAWLYVTPKNLWEDHLSKVLSLAAIALLALSFSTAANAVTKKKADGAVAAAPGMHQPKNAVYQKRMRTICGSHAKMTGRC